MQAPTCLHRDDAKMAIDAEYMRRINEAGAAEPLGPGDRGSKK